ITKVEGDPSAYLTVFAREKTPLEKLFEGDRLSVNPEIWMPTFSPEPMRPERRSTGRRALLALLGRVLVRHKSRGEYGALTRAWRVAGRSGLLEPRAPAEAFEPGARLPAPLAESGQALVLDWGSRKPEGRVLETWD